MSDKRRGLGRGLGALIPSSASANASGDGAAPSRPVDLFFPPASKRAGDAPAVEESPVEASPEVVAPEAVAPEETTMSRSAASDTTAKAPARKSAAAAKGKSAAQAG